MCSLQQFVTVAITIPLTPIVMVQVILLGTSDKLQEASFLFFLLIFLLINSCSKLTIMGSLEMEVRHEQPE